jgi:hypothetical protein
MLGLSHLNGGHLNTRIRASPADKITTFSPYTTSPTCTTQVEPAIVWEMVQLSIPEDTLEPLNGIEINLIQKIVATLLYYSRVAKSTMLVALGMLSKDPTKGTKKMAHAIIRVLN